MQHKKKDSSTKILLSTGASDTFSKQGIYDLAGNVYEWTLEYTSRTSGPCTCRGSSYFHDGGSARIRYYCDASFYYKDVGFRVSLY